MADPPGLRLPLPGLEVDRVESLLILGFRSVSEFNFGKERVQEAC